MVGRTEGWRRAVRAVEDGGELGAEGLHERLCARFTHPVETPAEARRRKHTQFSGRRDRHGARRGRLAVPWKEHMRPQNRAGLAVGPGARFQIGFVGVGAQRIVLRVFCEAAERFLCDGRRLELESIPASKRQDERWWRLRRGRPRGTRERRAG